MNFLQGEWTLDLLTPMRDAVHQRLEKSLKKELDSGRKTTQPIGLPIPGLLCWALTRSCSPGTCFGSLLVFTSMLSGAPQPWSWFQCTEETQVHITNPDVSHLPKDPFASFLLSIHMTPDFSGLEVWISKVGMHPAGDKMVPLVSLSLGSFSFSCRKGDYNVGWGDWHYLSVGTNGAGRCVRHLLTLLGRPQQP